jgi:hypothetical protein
MVAALWTSTLLSLLGVVLPGWLAGSWGFTADLGPGCLYAARAFDFYGTFTSKRNKQRWRYPALALIRT